MENNKKTGIITFHRSYNCGSMLQTYALFETLKKEGKTPEVIDFYTEGQVNVYNTFFKNNSLKNIVKNVLVFPSRKRIDNNNLMYEKFKNDNLKLSKNFKTYEDLNDENYEAVITGSDQVWNITIEDYSKAYYLPWVKEAKKIAYSPSFGSKNILKHSNNPEEFREYMNSFDSISIRERNGQAWIKDLINKEVPVTLDPTLLLEKEDYSKIESNDVDPKEEYIFFYSPGFDSDICEFVKKVSKHTGLKVITWSAKNYAVKRIKRFGFEQPDYENPSKYLSLIKNAKLVFTTSFHGAIFSTIYKKNFYVLKNGGMYGDDDRVRTLLSTLKLNDRLIEYNFNKDFDYLTNVDYTEYDKALKVEKEKSLNYLRNALNGEKNI